MNKHYLRRYLKFCQSYKNVSLEGVMTEIHHIIPRCLGGDDSDINLVELPVKAHILAHELLYKALPSNKKVAYAYRMMCLMKSGKKDAIRKPTLRQITKAREVNSRFPNHKGHTHSKSAKEKMRKAKLGKPGNKKGKKVSVEGRKNLSGSMKELFKDPYKHPRTNMKIYHFIHKDGRSVVGRLIGITILLKEEKLDAQKLKRVAEGLRGSHKGWKVLYVNTETA